MKSKAHNKWETSHDSCEANCSRVNKLDCVGHVQKRMMGKNLIGLTGRKKLADGKPVGGPQLISYKNIVLMYLIL